MSMMYLVLVVIALQILYNIVNAAKHGKAHRKIEEINDAVNNVHDKKDGGQKLYDKVTKIEDSLEKITQELGFDPKDSP